MKLFRVITLMLLVLTAGPITAVGFILIDSTVDITKTLTWELQQERADHASRQMATALISTAADLDLLLSNLNVGSMNVLQRQELLASILQKRPEINIIGLYDSQGQSLPNQLAFDSNSILPSELARHLQYMDRIPEEALSRFGLAFSRPYLIDRAPRSELGIEARQERVVAMMLKLSSGDAGAMGIEISLASVERLLARIRTGLRGQILLLDSQNRTMLRNAGSGVSKADAQLVDERLPQLMGSLTGANGVASQFSGARPLQLSKKQAVLAAYSSLPNPNWRIVSLEPLDDAYKVTHRMVWQVVWMVLASLALAVSLGMLFAFGLTRPIGKLVRGSLDIARGKFGTELDIQARNEIGELAHTFNYMSRQLLYYDGQNKELVDSLQRGYLETIRALANSIDAKDQYTRGHSGRVTKVALAVGQAMGLDEDQLKYLRYGGILHDIGKIGISEEILGKKGRLNDQERDIIQQHPVLGEKIIEPIDFLQPARPLVRHHHEWFNGEGYPDGLAGEDIPLGARILAAADTYDAVTSVRPYQAPVDNKKAIEILNKLRGRQLDPKVCDALIKQVQSAIDSGEMHPEQVKTGFADPASY